MSQPEAETRKGRPIAHLTAIDGVIGAPRLFLEESESANGIDGRALVPDAMFSTPAVL